MSFKLKGVDAVIRNIIKAGNDGVKAAERGLNQFGAHVLSKSQEIVPFDSGELQKAIIDEPVLNGIKVIGFDTPYAERQHEDTSLMHPGQNNRNPGRGAKGQAKFLEQPLNQEAQRLVDFIGNEVRKVL